LVDDARESIGVMSREMQTGHLFDSVAGACRVMSSCGTCQPSTEAFDAPGAWHRTTPSGRNAQGVSSPPGQCYALILTRIGMVNAMALRFPSAGLGIAAILLAGTCTAVADDTCFCRTSSGERVAVGETACLKTNSGPREARCGFVLNNTAWKFTGNSCPLVSYGSRPHKTAGLAAVLGR
jgi:hypothetical protein